MVSYKEVIDSVLRSIDEDIEDLEGFQSNWNYERLCRERRRITSTISRLEKQERNKLGKQYAIEFLKENAPLISEEGLDENEHHCEHTLMLERKRLLELLESK